MDRKTFYRAAARRYVADRHQRWVGAYSELSNGGRQADDYNYSAEAKKIFPRYNVLDAIGVEIDRLDPDELPPEGKVLRLLATAGEMASGLLTGHPPGTVEDSAERAERDEYLRFVDALAVAETAPIDPLPHRRTLTEEQSERWRSAVVAAWALENGRLLAPLQRATVNGHAALALRADSFWAGDRPEGPASLAVRQVLTSLGVIRLIELREHGPSFEREALTVACTYTGAEGLFFSGELDWLIFASFEGVVTLAGTVAEALHEGWPELHQHRWPSR